MNARIWIALSLGTLLVPSLLPTPLPACCPAPPPGMSVVNADQTVIIIWDAASKTQHFIRQASFKSEAQDFGFIVPSPTQPELEESDNEVFSFLLKVTEPEKQKVSRPSSGMGCACSAPKASLSESAVKVLEEKLVAGFNAVVLEADSANALVNWLQEHGYAFSPEVEAWAKPYIDLGWKFTALKVAKDQADIENKNVAVSALRMTFKTDRPLFPYREPDFQPSAEILGANHRLLRIYFLAEERYEGELTKEVPWTGKVAWSDKVKAPDRERLLELLKVSATSVSVNLWLTEFEDEWPYRLSPADLYFSISKNQNVVKRPPVIEYVSSPYPTDVMAYCLIAVVILPSLLRRFRPTNRRKLQFI